MKLIAVLLLLCTSCVHYNVYRVSRRERVIEVSAAINDDPERDRRRLTHAIVRKAKLLGCTSLTYTKVEDHSITGICTTIP